MYLSTARMALDPSPEELALITSLADACAWAGVEDKWDEEDGVIVLLRTDAFRALGKPKLLRDISGIPRESWEDTLRNLQVSSARSADGVTRLEGDGAISVARLTPVMASRLGALRRVCRAAAGLAPADQLDLPCPAETGPYGGSGTAAPDLGATAKAPGSGMAGGRRFKVNLVMDQGDESELATMAPDRLSKLIGEWAVRRNDSEPPDPAVEASGDQLAALGARLAQGRAPFVDF